MFKKIIILFTGLLAISYLSGCTTSNTQSGSSEANPLAMYAAAPVLAPYALAKSLTELPSQLQNQQGCYWMHNGGLAGNSFVTYDNAGHPIWYKTSIRSRDECYNLNSCGKGGNKSNGGCYKWAMSPTEPATWE